MADQPLSWPKALAVLALIGAGVGFLIFRSQSEHAEWAALEERRRLAEEWDLGVERAHWNRVFRTDFTLGQRSTACQDVAVDRIGYAAPLAALAVAADAIDLFYATHADRRKVRYFRCTVQGLEDNKEGSHPLLERFPAEAVQAAEDEQSLVERRDLRRDSASWFYWPDPRLLSLELAQDPRDGRLLVRTLQTRPEGLQVRRVPYDSDEYPVFTSSAQAAAIQGHPAVVREPRRWDHAVPAALDFLVDDLPPDLTLHFVRIEAQFIEIGIAGPRPDLGWSSSEARVLELDAAGDSRGGPRPGHMPNGCPTALPVTEVRARFASTCARQSGCRPDQPFDVAWFGCPEGGPPQWTLRNAAS